MTGQSPGRPAGRARTNAYLSLSIRSIWLDARRTDICDELCRRLLTVTFAVCDCLETRTWRTTSGEFAVRDSATAAASSGTRTSKAIRCCALSASMSARRAVSHWQDDAWRAACGCSPGAGSAPSERQAARCVETMPLERRSLAQEQGRTHERRATNAHRARGGEIAGHRSKPSVRAGRPWRNWGEAARPKRSWYRRPSWRKTAASGAYTTGR